MHLRNSRNQLFGLSQQVSVLICSALWPQSIPNISPIHRCHQRQPTNLNHNFLAVPLKRNRNKQTTKQQSNNHRHRERRRKNSGKRKIPSSRNYSKNVLPYLSITRKWFMNKILLLSSFSTFFLLALANGNPTMVGQAIERPDQTSHLDHGKRERARKQDISMEMKKKKRKNSALNKNISILIFKAREHKKVSLHNNIKKKTKKIHKNYKCLVDGRF